MILQYGSDNKYCCAVLLPASQVKGSTTQVFSAGSLDRQPQHGLFSWY
ncbi:hypothetical protein imdm_2163 [gamma proteobacterium IMCC2047]|nr:hypothetical protein imdm_2163 [gamma proteobacterium IMCC2047]